MVIVVYEDEVYRRHIEEKGFKTVKEAEDFLHGKGFEGSNGVYERENVGWVLYEKAYIQHIK